MLSQVLVWKRGREPSVAQSYLDGCMKLAFLYRVKVSGLLYGWWGQCSAVPWSGKPWSGCPPPTGASQRRALPELGWYPSQNAFHSCCPWRRRLESRCGCLVLKGIWELHAGLREPWPARHLKSFQQEGLAPLYWGCTCRRPPRNSGREHGDDNHENLRMAFSPEILFRIFSLAIFNYVKDTCLCSFCTHSSTAKKVEIYLDCRSWFHPLVIHSFCKLFRGFLHAFSFSICVSPHIVCF